MSKQAFLIQCLQARPGGTSLTMADGFEINFRPDDKGRHVAQVDNEAHFARLLSIPEGYKLIGAVTAPVIGAPAAPPAFVAPAAVTPPPAAPVLPSPPAVSATETILNAAASHSAPTSPTDTPPVVAPVPDAADTTDPVLAAMSLDDLKALFGKETGRTAHGKAKPETLIAQIEAHRAELAGQ
ncbi:hypothetical protein [Cereibacter changlensis]|uniref:hypothetical protein n=1 Tax=Cereibacter changlensis TaxID=402884 RepID=UPI0040341385